MNIWNEWTCFRKFFIKLGTSILFLFSLDYFLKQLFSGKNEFLKVIRMLHKMKNLPELFCKSKRHFLSVLPKPYTHTCMCTHMHTTLMHSDNYTG